MKKKNTIKITENDFNQIISECVIKELNEGHGWETFKDSVKAGWNSDGSSEDSGKGMSMKDTLKGKPNKAKSQYHSVMSKTAENPASRKNHAHQATFTEPGASGSFKRGAAVAGAVGGAVAKSAVNGAKKGFNAIMDGAKGVADKIEKKADGRKAFKNRVNSRMNDISSSNPYPSFTMDKEYDDKVDKKAKKNLSNSEYPRLKAVESNNPYYDPEGYKMWLKRQKEEGK